MPQGAKSEAQKQKDRHNRFFLLLLLGGCIATGIAMKFPWPTALLAIGLLGFAGAIMSGKVRSLQKSRRTVAIGSAAFAIYVGAFAVFTIAKDAEAEEARQQHAAAQAAAEVQRVDSLRASALARIERARQHLAGGAEAAANLDPQPMILAAEELTPIAELQPPADGFLEIQSEILALNEELNRTGAEQHLTEAESHADDGEWAAARSSLASAAPYLAPLGAAELNARQAALEERGAAYWVLDDAVRLAEATLDADHADPIVAETEYDAALSTLDTLEGEALDANTRRVRGLRSRLERVRRQNHRRAERLRTQQAARAEQLSRCGRRPSISGWDGELIGSERFVARSAHDPDSIDVEKCTQPTLAQSLDHCWISTCDVLGRNGFGAMTRRRMQFEVRGGNVVSAR